MKRLFSVLLFALVVLVGCEKFDDSDIWDKLKEHEERISRLETLCDQLNGNIESMQAIITALQNNDYVTNVVAIEEDGVEIGYTVNFSKGGSVTIYHGRNGDTPNIGVKRDTDGVYYWTLDGEWILDESGNKIPSVGSAGDDGEDGDDGNDGKDGITPQLKIEDDYWYVSYDNGITWERLGKAVGEDGENGEKGEDGDSMFSDVEITDYYVIVTLADGTLFKIPTWRAYEELKALVDLVNTNVSSLEAIVTALQNNDYVTSVVAIKEDGEEIGYTVNFSKGGSVTIYHGRNGDTPNIGVKRDTDGVYYWTLDGEWILDESGNKIPSVGSAGDDGEDGDDGNDGKDGITPQLKIEDDYWYVSYDNGITWERLGKAVGEDGENGEKGEDGDSMFSDVEITDYYVIVTLADGTLFKIPTWRAYEELKALVDLVNTNVSSLETIVTALQNNDYVTGVVPQMDGNEVVGYVLTFAKSGAIVISNGRDGEDGIDGKTPVIGVSDGGDGVYYWTLDGNWLTDSNGNKVPTTGSVGEDGITPELKIEEEYWYVSYDDGETWEQLCKAVGEDGDDGDSFFQRVDTSNPEFVVITLSDGTTFNLLTSAGVSQGEPGDIYASAYGVVPGIVDMNKMATLMAAAAGKTIRFNSGEYEFPAHISVPSDISFVGNTKTVFRLAKNSGSNVLFYIVSANNVTISRLFIDGGEDRVQPIGNIDDILDGTNAGNRYGIYCLASRRIKISDVEVYGWSLCGLYCLKNDAGGGEEGRFYHAIELTNSSFYYNYYGVWYDEYGEYNKAEGCNFGDNFIGVRNDGGNNMYVGCFFNSNYCGFVLNGNGVTNESHGGCYSCTYNHNSISGLGGGIAIYAIKSTVGWNFTGQNIWYGAVTLKDCKGIIFDGNIWGNVQFKSTSSEGLKNQNIVTNTYFHTGAESVMRGNDGSTYFDLYIPGGVPGTSEE